VKIVENNASKRIIKRIKLESPENSLPKSSKKNRKCRHGFSTKKFKNPLEKVERLSATV
jgi:hypothetical protein